MSKNGSCFRCFEFITILERLGGRWKDRCLQKKELSVLKRENYPVFISLKAQIHNFVGLGCVVLLCQPLSALLNVICLTEKQAGEEWNEDSDKKRTQRLSFLVDNSKGDMHYYVFRVHTSGKQISRLLSFFFSLPSFPFFFSGTTRNLRKMRNSRWAGGVLEM